MPYKEILVQKIISNEGFLSDNNFVDNIIQKIDEANGSDILLRIASPGGSVFLGYSIARKLMEYKGKTKALVSGYAASMAAYLLAFVDEVEADSNAMIMLHKAWSYSEDDSTIKLLAQINETMAKNLIDKRGMDKDIVNKIFIEPGNYDYWFTASEAKEVKLVDTVTEITRKDSEPQYKIAAMTKDNILSEYYEIFGNPKNIKDFTNLKNEVSKMGLFNAKDIEEIKTAVNGLKAEIDNIKAEQENTETGDSENTENVIPETIQAKLDEYNLAIEEIKAELANKTNEMDKAIKDTSDLLIRFGEKLDALINILSNVSNEFEVPETQAQLQTATGKAAKTQNEGEMNFLALDNKLNQKKTK